MVSFWKTVGVTFVSGFLSTVVTINAFYQKKQFYPSVVHITNSSPSMAVFYVQGFVIAWIVSQVANKVFFGRLMDSEVEHVVDEFWYAVPETILLFAAFREDLSPLIVVSLTMLFLFKVFHWLADARIDHMERSPLITNIFHVRAIFLLVILISSDCFMMSRNIFGVISSGPSVEMVFALEYAVLLLLALDVLGKYILHCIDRQSDNPWENKPIYKSYLEVFLGFFRVSAFFGFMLFMAKVHIFPLYITRRVFVSIKLFKKSIEDVVRSRRALHNLNNLFPDVAPEQFEGRDNTCMVCREEMALNCKMLPCGHIFHAACLRSWFQRQQVCPTCTTSVLTATREQQALMQQQNNRLRAQREQQQPNEPQPVVPPVPPIFPQGLPGWMAPPPQGEGPNQEQPEPDHTDVDTGDTTDNPVGEQADEEQPNQESKRDSKPETPSSSQTGTGAGVYLSALFPGTPPGGGVHSMNLLPPIPPHFMPFGATPVDPNTLRLNLLSDQELSALEGTERDNVEARISVLRNIQLLLDSAVAQMNQYYATTGNLPYQDSLLLTDISRSAKKQGKKRSSVKEPTSTPFEKSKSPNSSVKSFEGGIGRSMTWSPSVATTPSVFSGIMKKEEEEAEDLDPHFSPSDSLEIHRSMSNPPSTDAELRQRRLERLESSNKISQILEQSENTEEPPGETDTSVSAPKDDQ